MKLRFLAILVLMIFLIGCQKYGLSVQFPKNYEQVKETAAEADIQKVKDIDFSQVPTTRAIIMKDGMLDLSAISAKNTLLQFSDFKIKLEPDETNSYFKILTFEPRDYHNDYTIKFLLDPEGRIIGQAIIKKQNGLVAEEDQLILKR